MTFQRYRDSKAGRALAAYLAVSLLAEVIFPTAVYGLTGGPTQPEVASFTPIGASDMVNLFTGDFSYNIPLLDVGGYPLNLSYNAGPGMEDEASWVGLGWTLNPGAIVRNMRGLPDDFNGDEVESEKRIRPNVTVGASLGIQTEVFGYEVEVGETVLKDKISLNGSAVFNSYKGLHFSFGISPELMVGDGAKSNTTFGLGLKFSGSDGIGITPTVNYSRRLKTEGGKIRSFSRGIGMPFNTMDGLKAININSAFNGGHNFEMRSSNHATYIPDRANSQINLAFTFSLKTGVEAFGVFPNFDRTIFASAQWSRLKPTKSDAYGYMYAHNSNDKSLMDVNREKEEGFSELTANLSIPNFTHDLFAISGQGIGGTYRLHRNDIGVLHDPLIDGKESFDGGGLDLGFETGAGAVAKLGVDVNIYSIWNTEGRWKKGNDLAKNISFKKPQKNSPVFEPWYFKRSGEMNVEVAPEFYENMGEDKAVRALLGRTGTNYSKVYNKLVTESRDTLTPQSHRSLIKRTNRKQPISVLTGTMAAKMGLERTIKNYPFNKFELKGITSEDTLVYPQRNFSYKVLETEDREQWDGGESRGDHISEMTVWREDGARYIYNVPIYNTLQKEIAFSINSNERDDLVLGSYAKYSEKDASRRNRKGKDQFYSSKSLPPYASSFLLRTVLSAGYQDVDGIEGPSDGDYGSYTKFNYTKESDVKWRIPFIGANYNKGFISKELDDKASYLYGEKEVRYLHSIETKTHVAEFYTSYRNDNAGAFKEHPGIGKDGVYPVGKKSRRLSSIRLYSKEDKIKNGVNATPVKTVHFEYNYTLCPGVVNSSGTADEGKLTLSKVYFTYGDQTRGKLNAYSFVYADPDHDGEVNTVVNPSYHPKGVDRWGSYQPFSNDEVYSLDNDFFPYVRQSKINYEQEGVKGLEETGWKYKADMYASAWNLSQIDLPTGASLVIDYEADDYAFVQDKKAMMMFPLIGTGEGKEAKESAQGSWKSSEDYLYFNLITPLDEALGRSAANEYVRANYATDQNQKSIEDLYFNFYTDLDEGKYERVSGYGQIEEIGACEAVNGKYRHGYIKFKETSVQGGNAVATHVEKAAWQMIRQNFYYIMSGNKEKVGFDTEGNAEDVLTNSIEAILIKLGSFFKNDLIRTEAAFKAQEYADKFDLSNSWVRLYHPEGNKKGGGHRVKRIKLKDNWSSTGSKGLDYTYGQSYEYTSGLGNSSSGVAAYEPFLGGEENPLRLPTFKREKKFLGTENTSTTEGPYGETFYPGPVVGYSRVVVKSLHADENIRSANGKTEHQFYTSRDYPTISDRTKMIKRTMPLATNLLKFLKIDLVNKVAVSQGFMVKTNDMHGKQKAINLYSRGETSPYSSTRYYYKTKGEYVENEFNELDNRVKIVKKDGEPDDLIEERIMGVDYDLIVDRRSSEFFNAGATGQYNVDAFIIPMPFPVPIPVPTYWGGVSYEENRFYAMSTIKVINQYGILDRVEVKEDGAEIITTRDLLYDEETGIAILNQSNNRFGKPVYQFTYPAHWAYDKMGANYHNLMAKFYDLDLSNLPDEMIEGDHLYIKELDQVLYVEERIEKTETFVSTRKVVVNQGGEVIFSGPQGGNVTATVIKSGRTNQASTRIGTITTLNNPILDKTLVFTDVIDAGAVTFQNSRPVFCPCEEETVPRNITMGGGKKIVSGFENRSAVKMGLKGIWSPHRNHYYKVQRTQQNSVGLNMQTDGVYTDFVPYWGPSSEGWTSSKDPSWLWQTEVTLVSPFGLELETRDTLGIYSTALYGHKHALPTAVISNSTYRESAFDSFEDYDGSATKRHFQFEVSSGNGGISNKKAHTGRRSIKVLPRKKVRFSRDLFRCKVKPPKIG